MYSQNYDYNAAYRTSNVAYGTYPDCTNGHAYKEHGSHWRNDLSEGGSGDTPIH